jgi:hypothetical protein
MKAGMRNDIDVLLHSAAVAASLRKLTRLADRAFAVDDFLAAVEANRAIIEAYMRAAEIAERVNRTLPPRAFHADLRLVKQPMNVWEDENETD